MSSIFKWQFLVLGTTFLRCKEMNKISLWVWSNFRGLFGGAHKRPSRQNDIECTEMTSGQNGVLFKSSINPTDWNGLEEIWSRILFCIYIMLQFHHSQQRHVLQQRHQESHRPSYLAKGQIWGGQRQNGWDCHHHHLTVTNGLWLIHLHCSHLADALIQRDLQEQLGLSALLKVTLTDFSPSRLRDSNQQPFNYWTNNPNR